MSRTLINPNEEFGALFPGIKRSSWRWECQGDYKVDHPKVQRWREGKTEDPEDTRGWWIEFQRGLKEAGIPFERVRMLTEPLTEYLRWMLDITDWNIDAGEDIRWLPESKARELDMPRYDFYLFDDNRVVLMHFDDEKLLSGAEIVDDADVVAQHQEYRQRVWSLATPHREYVNSAQR
jgi:hypothetical protein